MNAQTLIVVLLVAAATAYFVRNLIRSMTAKGCASGCGGCASSQCSLRKLEALNQRGKG